MSMTCGVYAVPPDDAARLQSDAESFEELIWKENPRRSEVWLEKSWHGLNFLLTGSAWESEGPLALIIAGGEDIPGSDGEYGPARLFGLEDVTQINKAITAVSDEQLWSRFDPELMAREDIYPGIWDEPESDLREEYLHYFHELKRLIRDAANQGDSIVVTLG